MVVSGDWKYVDRGTRKELYDLAADPYELTNLSEAEDMKPRRAQMRALTDALGVPT